MDLDSTMSDRISQYEELIASMQEELSFYKNEHIGLRNEVFKVLDENKRLAEQAKKCLTTTERFPWAPQGQKLDDIALNLQGQIRLLVDENKNLDNIWQISKDTIAELEKEIAQYRELLNSPNSVLKLKEDYERKILELEHKLEVIMSESEKVKCYNNEILGQKVANDQKINELLRKLEDLNAHEHQLMERQEEIEGMQNDNRKLIHELDQAKRRVNEALRREKDALQKMQEALLLAETAAEKKVDADQQFHEIKEEYDKLVQVLSEVMRDAGQQVEEKVQKMRTKYKEQIRKLQALLDRSMEELKKERETRICISGQAEELQTKLMDALKGSQLLDQDLYEATQNIVAMELKIGAYEEVISSTEVVKMMNEQKIADLERFLQKNKSLKGKWCATLEEITAEFDQLIEEEGEEEGEEKDQRQFKARKNE